MVGPIECSTIVYCTSFIAENLLHWYSSHFVNDMSDLCMQSRRRWGEGGAVGFMHGPFSWREKVVITLRAMLHYTTLFSMVHFMASIWATS